MAGAVAGCWAGFAVLADDAGAAFRNSWHPHRSCRHRSAGLARRRRPPARAEIVTSVVIAGALATGLDIGHPYWAMVGAVVPLAARDLLPQLGRGTHRVIGTFLGPGLFVLLLWWDPDSLALIANVVLLQGLASSSRRP